MSDASSRQILSFSFFFQMRHFFQFNSRDNIQKTLFHDEIELYAYGRTLHASGTKCNVDVHHSIRRTKNTCMCVYILDKKITKGFVDIVVVTSVILPDNMRRRRAALPLKSQRDE